MKQLDIIIPVGKGDNPQTTLDSLSQQTFKDFNIICSYDTLQSANATRNSGFKLSSAPYILFSDADINWYPDALSILVMKLDIYTRASYVYGAYYLVDGKDRNLRCNRFFNATGLRQLNYISSMSIIRREHFPGWDEDIQRLQDWALWLDMLNKKRYGVFCGKILFETEMRKGISSLDNPLSWQEAHNIVKAKYGNSL